MDYFSAGILFSELTIWQLCLRKLLTNKAAESVVEEKRMAFLKRTLSGDLPRELIFVPDPSWGVHTDRGPVDEEEEGETDMEFEREGEPLEEGLMHIPGHPEQDLPTPDDVEANMRKMFSPEDVVLLNLGEIFGDDEVGYN